jgi:hypothetical protein
MTWLLIAGLAVTVILTLAVQLARAGKGSEQLRRQRLREHLRAEAERLVPDDSMPHPGMHGRWPADLCAYPPCSPEDGWVCTACQGKPAAERVGRHRAVWTGPLDDQDATVIAAIVTGARRRRRP